MEPLYDQSPIDVEPIDPDDILEKLASSFNLDDIDLTDPDTLTRMSLPDQTEHTVMQVPADGPWTRHADESAVAYKAFCTYRDLGPSRSLDEAYRQHTGQQKGNKRATGHWTRWYSKFEWRARAEAYDAHLELLARRDREAAYIKDLQNLQDRQKKLAQATLGAAIHLLQKAGERLRKLEAGDIDTKTLPSYFRAADAITEAATNAEATALGLHELITLLDARDSDQNA